MAYTSSQILASVKRNQTIVSSTFRFTDDDLYAMIDEEIESTVIPMILRLHADRLLFSETQALTANVSTYALPYRAVASQLRDVVIQDSATAPTYKRNLAYLDYTVGSQTVRTGSPTGSYFANDASLVLVPGVSSSTSEYLGYSYPIRHSRLVSSDAVAVISSVNYTTGVITLTAAPPSTFTTSTYLDFTIANDRSKPRIAAFDKISSAIGALDITFAVADIPTGLVSGDRISLANETDVICLPNECYKYLCKAAEIKILEAQKDLQALQEAQPKLIQARRAMEDILTPRITGEPKVILNQNGLLRNRAIRRVGTTV